MVNTETTSILTLGQTSTIIMSQTLLGRQDVRVDEKGRILIPTKLYDELKGDSYNQETAGKDGSFNVVVTFGSDSNLRIFPPVEYEKLAKELEKKSEFDAEWADIKTFVTGNAETVKVDKTRRVRLSTEIQEIAELGKDVSILKHGKCLVLHDKIKYIKEISKSIRSKIREKSHELG